ncbi:MAG: BrxE family protein [Caldilineaceae bacterium]|nr:BrxE family protein [Caldilineaceae bacterium]
MIAAQLESLATLRILVGYLGEREHFAWWQSAFFAPGSQAFLAPLFARTQLLAQCNGVTRAAGLIHDERIGVGNVYHLFRLPEDLEQSIYRVLSDDAVCARVESLLTDSTAAMSSLRKIADQSQLAGVGPTRVGTTSDLRQTTGWSHAAAYYLHAFEHNLQVYPYFTDGA